MRAPTGLVSLVFRDPGAIHRFSIGDWDRAVRQARETGLLARLHALLQQEGLDASIPAVAHWHFEVATALAISHQCRGRRELRRLCALLAGPDPLIVLKGAAYLAADLSAARGRTIDEIDLLVPSERRDEVESTLRRADWHAVDLPDYDQRYYRRWKIDAPRRQHLVCSTAINIYLAIVPDAARFRPDAATLCRSATAVPGFPGFAVLSAKDRVLHAATLLCHDDGLQNGLRDLSDLDLLLREAATEADFWSQLVTRAEEMELGRPLFYALRYARHFFGTPVPDEVRDHLTSASPSVATLKLMDAIYTRLLESTHHSGVDALTPLARRAAYMRAHWLRRPPRSLVPHLLHKILVSPDQRDPKPA